MKKSFQFFVYLLMLLIIFSCKNENKPEGLQVGRANISFNTNPSFEGSNSFSVNNTNSTSTTAQTLGSGGAKNILLIASEKENGLGRTISIDISISGTANTSSGSIIADLARNSGALPLAKITLKNNTALLGTPTYTSTSGTLTITKLSSSEIEGTFSGAFSDNFGTSAFNVSDGKFAGKF